MYEASTCSKIPNYKYGRPENILITIYELYVCNCLPHDDTGDMCLPGGVGNSS